MITLAAQSVNILELADWISSDWLIKNQEVSAMLVISIVVFIEYILYDYRLQQNRKQLSKLQQNLMILGESKKKQQQKANRHSDHTEKLKGFIADKLVEYMDYDEKYIHFKGIASEVRHNGVISYDKVTTALNKAIEQQGFLSLYEQQNDDNPSNEEPNEQTLAALVDYQGAVDAMRYLWALLDLSTADNMAIHIGKIARSHDIPIMRLPPLTRAIYFSTEVYQEIPKGLYIAVAQVLAYIFQLKRRNRLDEVEQP